MTKSSQNSQMPKLT